MATLEHNADDGNQSEPIELPKCLPKVKRVILVLSGKGGVGKSTVALQIAISLAQENRKVGLLDLDLCGPSLPLMLGLEDSVVTQGDSGWIPVLSSHPNLSVMSIGFLLKGKRYRLIDFSSELATQGRT